MVKFTDDDSGTARLYPHMHWMRNGIVAAVSKMAFGNELGVKIDA